MARLARQDLRPWSRLLLGPGEGERVSSRSPGPLALLDRSFVPAGGRPESPYQDRGPAPDPFSRGYFLDRYVY